jgi:hypothetical protein
MYITNYFKYLRLKYIQLLLRTKYAAFPQHMLRKFFPFTVPIRHEILQIFSYLLITSVSEGIICSLSL